MSTPAARFNQHLDSLGIPVHGVGIDGSKVTIYFKDEATRQQKDTANAEIATFDFSEKTQRDIGVIRDAVKALGTNDRNRILDRIMADYLLTDPRFAANLGISIEN